MLRITTISASNESRMRSDWRFWAITTSKRRFSALTVSSVLSASASLARSTTNRAAAAPPPATHAATARRDHARQPPRRSGGRGQERRRPFHPHRDLLTPRLDVGGEVGALGGALDDLFGVLGCEPLLALQVFAEAPRAHRQVPCQDR